MVQYSETLQLPMRCCLGEVIHSQVTVIFAISNRLVCSTTRRKLLLQPTQACLTPLVNSMSRYDKLVATHDPIHSFSPANGGLPAASAAGSYSTLGTPPPAVTCLCWQTLVVLRCIAVYPILTSQLYPNFGLSAWCVTQLMVHVILASYSTEGELSRR